MRQILTTTFAIFIFVRATAAQNDTTGKLRAFPITSYILDINDSVKIVQIEMPEGIILKEKQLGVLYGKYNTGKDDAVEKGYGRCNLIKGNYYYFTIGHNKSGLPAKEGDLLYVSMPSTSIYYGKAPSLAAHFIRLLNVYEQPLYDRYLIFNQWTAEDERKLLDSLAADIRFTGDYFLQNNPESNVMITTGTYAGKKVLEVMSLCAVADVTDFINYMLARPRIYAGGSWKVSEIFATWANAGAPKVVKNP